MKNYTDYEDAEKAYRAEQKNRRCIDNSVTGCGNCVGWCDYAEHKGYLTEKLRKKHKCMEKHCHYYHAKPKKQKSCTGPFAVLTALLPLP